MCGQRRDPGYYLLFGLRVADAARGKGVGTLLLVSCWGKGKGRGSRVGAAH